MESNKEEQRKDVSTETVKINNNSAHANIGYDQNKDKDLIEANVISVSIGIKWLEVLIKERMDSLVNDTKVSAEDSKMSNLPVFSDDTAIKKLLLEYGESEVEVVLLLLAFTSWFRPVNLTSLVALAPDSDMRFIEPGGVYRKTNSRFIPTLQTAVFILAGNDVTLQGYYHTVISTHNFFREGVLHLRSLNNVDNFPMEQILEPDIGYYHYLINGKVPRMDVTPDFPASLLQTNKTIDDLILKDTTKAQLDIIMNYAKVKERLFSREGVDEKVNQGFLALLYGPPGTGKTFSVAVLSKKLGVEAYRVDLSRIISKYIGETEKNLEKVFTRFEEKNCILMFDEADALFGKRTEVKDAKDRFANQEVAYLLQRMETFPGLVILASNFNQNLDIAFKRRILTSVYFAQPDSKEREILWRNSLPAYFKFEDEELPIHLADNYSLTGANIANVIKLWCIQAESKGNNILKRTEIEPFIYLEMNKEGVATTRKQLVNHQRISN